MSLWETDTYDDERRPASSVVHEDVPLFTDASKSRSLLAVVSIVVLVGMYVFVRRRAASARRKRAADLIPAVEFLIVLSDPSESVRDLQATLEAAVRASITIGMLRAMKRCVREVLGGFVSADVDRAAISERTPPSGGALRQSRRMVARVACSFEKVSNVQCTVAWLASSTSSVPTPRRPKATGLLPVDGFDIRLPDGGVLDPAPHVAPRDFEDFAEVFVARMLGPSSAVGEAMGMMTSTLVEQVVSSLALKDAMSKVHQVMGGFKDPRSPDIAVSISRKTTVGEGANQRTALEFEVVVIGRDRDVKATLTVVLPQFRTLVLRYSFSALPPKEQMVFVDETGTPVPSA